MSKQNKTEFIINGKGVLAYTNIESVCKHGKEEEVQEVIDKLDYSLDKTQNNIEQMELGFELLEVDFVDLLQRLEALKSVGASKKEIKKIIGARHDKIKEYAGLISYRDYLTSMKEKLEEAK